MNRSNPDVPVAVETRNEIENDNDDAEFDALYSSTLNEEQEEIAIITAYDEELAKFNETVRLYAREKQSLPKATKILDFWKSR